MGNENVLYVHNGILFRHHVILSFEATRTDVEIIMLSEISQPEKDKIFYHMISLICGI